jgi:hypothetical protein
MVGAKVIWKVEDILLEGIVEKPTEEFSSYWVYDSYDFIEKISCSQEGLYWLLYKENDKWYIVAEDCVGIEEEIHEVLTIIS